MARCHPNPQSARPLRRLLLLLSVRSGAQAERQGRSTGVCEAGRTAHREVHAPMKMFAERNPLRMGVVGMTGTLALMVAAMNYDELPFVNNDKNYSAYFAEAGGLASGDAVRVSGFRVGQVSDIELDGPRVLVKFH